MGNSNARKGAKNIVFGLLSQIVTIILGVVIPRLFLVGYGSEMNGLLNSVSQVYMYMVLLEAGVGAATTQALYKPLGLSDRDSINGVLAATHTYYRRIGAIYLASVIALSFIYPMIVPSTIPFWTIAGVIFLNGISGVISFFFQGKFQLLMKADGRTYYITNIELLIHIAVSASKIVLILCGTNILVIQAVTMLLNLSKMVFITLYVRKVYPWIDLSVKPDFQAIAQKNSAFIHQISDLVFRNTDVLVLTVMPGCGLLTVSVYTMYNMLFGMIGTAINTLGSGIEFIMGQTFNTDREKYIRLHDIYETFGMAIIFALYTTAYLFILPFLKLYTKGVNDINYIDPWLAFLFILTFFFSAGRRPSAIVINFAQHFKKTQNRAILEAVINLTSSVILVFWLGIYGVLLGTVAGLFYRTNDMILYSNHVILERKAWPTYKRWGTNFAVFAVCAGVFSVLLRGFSLGSYVSIVLAAVVVCPLILLAFLGVNVLLNPHVFRDAKELILPHVRKLLRRSA